MRKNGTASSRKRIENMYLFVIKQTVIKYFIMVDKKKYCLTRKQQSKLSNDQRAIVGGFSQQLAKSPRLVRANKSSHFAKTFSNTRITS